MENNQRESQNQSYFVQDLLYHFTEWFKRFWIFILIFAVFGAAGMAGYTYKTYVPQYSASATFTVNVDVNESSNQHYNKATANQLAKTFPNILTSSSLNKIVCSDLELGYLDDTITASVLEDTNLFTITVTSYSPQRAYDVLNSVIAHYPDVAKFVIGSTQLSLIDTSSISTKPINYPNYFKNALIGTLAGAFLALAIIVLLAFFTNTIIRANDIVSAFNVKCLGSIPELTKKKRSKEVSNLNIPNIDNPNVNHKFREGVFTLRNNVIRISKEKGYKTILVTSTVSGEGKSVVSINLARSIAMKGYKTVLVDFDLRAPRIKAYIDVDSDINSVSDCIEGNIPAKDCVYATNSENFFVALEENENQNAIDLVGSKGAIDFINKLKASFEFVIIDTPPTAYLADSTVIGDYVDAGVYVVAQDVVSRRNVGNSLSDFDNLNVDIIGAVLNRITKGAESLGYERYYHRYYGGYRYSGYKKYGTNKSKKTNDDEKKKDIIKSSLEDNGITFDE